MQPYSNISLRCEMTRSACESVGAQSGNTVILRQSQRSTANPNTVKPMDLCQS